MKRSDLSTDEVLATVRAHGTRAFEALTARYPAKIVRAAFERDISAGYLGCGVSPERPWLEPAGNQRRRVRTDGSMTL